MEGVDSLIEACDVLPAIPPPAEMMVDVKMIEEIELLKRENEWVRLCFQSNVFGRFFSWILTLCACYLFAVDEGASTDATRVTTGPGIERDVENGLR